MSREYKFRAWDYKNSKMLFPMSFQSGIGVNIPNEYMDYTSTEILLGCRFNTELMQFTGRKDINNIEIYEGDIIIMNDYPFYGNAEVITDSNQQCDELNYVGVVEWDVYIGYFLNLKPISKRVRGGACGSTLQDYDGMLVIGNIYENPELLEYR